MKKTILLALAIVATVSLSAQIKKNDAMKLKDKKHQAREWMCAKQEQRKTFIINKMELKETERAAFESLYDAYRKKVWESKAKMKKSIHQMNDSCTNEQYEKCLETIHNEKNTQAKLDSEFYIAMKKILSARQIYLYYTSDKKFNKLMMRDMNQKKGKCKK